ncbi:hypothetical protein L4D77_27200 [Photobacterium frigidiphilum]|uniref:hypothetical protein n=1 Tax=Photobacterium frigidiphilum TaxID=264736 RepID=UPI003D11F943
MMNKKTRKFFALFFLAVVSTSLYLYMSVRSEPILAPVSNLDTPRFVNETIEPIGKESVKPVAKQLLTKQSPSLSVISSDQLPDELQREVTEQFTLLSKDYAAEVAYPAYSQPLSASDVSYLEPNYFSVVDVPVLDGSHTASLSLDKYRFYFPEPVTVRLDTDLAVDNVVLELFEPTTREQLVIVRSQEVSVIFVPKESWPQEIRVKATASFVEGTDVLTADFRFFVPVAYVESVGLPYPVNADMCIPLTLDVKKSGIYRIRANLFTTDGQAVAVLTNKKKLSPGEATLDLKAHKSVLAGRNGAFELRNIQVEKMSSYPGEKNSYGVSQFKVLPIEFFDVSTLSDEKHQPSAEEQQRLEFLQEVANG